jgi:signal transduction histidine kinase
MWVLTRDRCCGGCARKSEVEAWWHVKCSTAGTEVRLFMAHDSSATQDGAASAQTEELFTSIGPAETPSAVALPPASLAEALDRLDVEAARRAQAEEALRDVEERFRQIGEHAGKFLWMSDPQTDELIYVSPGCEEVWARTRENSYASAREWAATFRGGRRGAPNGEHAEIYQVAAADGRVTWIRDRMFPIRDAAGQVIRMLGIAEDITDLKRAQEVLQTLDCKWRAITSTVMDMIFRIRKDGTVIEYKPADNVPFTLEESTVLNKTLKQLLPASLATEAMQKISQALKTKQVQTMSGQFLLTEEVRDFEARAVFCGTDEVLAVVRDVTDRKRLEREILEVSSREQQRIGQDLHDSLGQHLTGITFLTKVLERKLDRENPEAAKEAAEIGRLVIQALAQTRNLARGLVPAEVERNGLVPALTELAESIERMCNVKCNFKSRNDVVVQDSAVATHVFRIAQEAINNSVKHGKCKQIDVTLSTVDDHLELCVTDNGTGFDSKAKMDGLGLKIMHYRARRIGGSLEISSPEKGGTRVTCSFRNKYESN